MARMLQALKNLEARSPRPAAGPGPKSKPAQSDATSATAGNESPQTAPAPPKAPDLLPEVAKSIEAVSLELAKLDIAPLPPQQKLALPEPQSGLFSSSSQFASAPFGDKAEAAPPPRPACEIERAVQRTLSDSVRSRPVRELADRLWKDMEQTAAKTAVLVGIGSASDPHEALVYAATLTAEQAPRRVLLVDADFGRRSLSEALDYARETGLAECIHGGTNATEHCQPTSAERLSLLPAGQLSLADLAADASGLARVLEQLAQTFDCILVDGGRTEDAAARTLARVADAAYFVVQLGAVDTAAAQAALADFRAAGARVLGCIAT